MADVKPAEVSAILREQLSGFRSEAELQEVGTVLQIGDGIARIYGLNGVQYGELIEFDGGLQGIALNLEEDNVGAVLLGRSSQVKEYKGIVPVTITTATELDKATKEAIVQKIEAKVNGQLEVIEKIDESLIGGFIVRMGDTQIDASVLSQFNNLKQRLTR